MIKEVLNRLAVLAGLDEDTEECVEIEESRGISDDTWDSFKMNEKRKYVKEHPTSRFAKDPKYGMIKRKAVELTRENFNKDDANFMDQVQRDTLGFVKGKDKAEWNKLIGKLGDRTNDKKLNKFLDDHFSCLKASDLRKYMKKFGASLSELKTGVHKVDYPAWYQGIMRKRAKAAKAKYPH